MSGELESDRGRLAKLESPTVGGSTPSLSGASLQPESNRGRVANFDDAKLGKPAVVIVLHVAQIARSLPSWARSSFPDILRT